MAKKSHKGRLLEILTARIEHAVGRSGITIKSPDHLEDKIAGYGTREVDVSLTTTVGSVDVVVIVECRDRSRVPDVTWIEQIATKRKAVGADKAVAVSTRSFSKKALLTARRYGIDTRTLNQVDPAEIKRWTGHVKFFRQRVSLDYTNLSVTLGGTEALSKQTTDEFDQLVKESGFDSRFIALAGEEGLYSPRDILRRNQQATTGVGPLKITIPAKSSVMISDDPFHSIIAPVPDDGTSVEREHTIEFEDGTAAFGLGPDRRNLLAVHLKCAARLASSTLIEPDSYRYSSSKGVIEIAAVTAELRGTQVNILEHRAVPPEIVRNE